MRSWVLVAAAVCLLAGSCLADSKHAFPVNKKFVYRYYAIARASMDDVSTVDGAVYAIRGRLNVVTLPEKLIMWMEDVKVATDDEGLVRTEPMHLDLDFRPDGALAELLKKPLEVYYENGLVDHLKIEEDADPRGVNLLKAVANIYQLPKNRLQRYLKEDDAMTDADLAHFFKVAESGIGGKCATHYQVESNEWPGNPNERCLNITKLKNYRNCEDDEMEWIRTTHFPNQCDSCDSEKSHPFTKNVVTVYEIKVKDTALMVENVYCDGLVMYKPYSSEADGMYLHHNLTLILDQVTEASENEKRTSNSKEINPTFSFPTVVENDMDLENPDINEANPTMIKRTDRCHREEASRLIKEAAKLIHGHSTVEELRVAPPKLTYAAKALRTCNFKELYEFIQPHLHLETKTGMDLIEAKLAFDCLSWLGTNPVIPLYHKLITEKLIPIARGAIQLQRLSSYLWAPSSPVLENLWKLCENTVVQQSPQLFSTCVSSYGLLVAQSCGEGVAEYPTPPYVDDFCSDAQLRNYIKILEKKLDEERKTSHKLALIAALANTRSALIIPILEPYIVGDADDNNLVQVRAILALKQVAPVEPDTVIDLLLRVLYDPEEDVDCRTSALDIILYAAKEIPYRSVLQSIAMFTWEEESDQLRSYIYSTFDSVSNLTHPCWTTISTAAEEALELMDDDDEGGMWEGVNNFFDRNKGELDIASLLHFRFLGESATPIPQRMVIKLLRTISTYSSLNFMGNLHTTGMRSFIHSIFGPDAAFDTRTIMEMLKTVDEPNELKGFRDIVDSLNIKTRTDDDFEGVATFRWENEFRQFYYNSEVLLQILESMMGNLDDWIKKLSVGVSVNIVRAVQPLRMRKMIPSDMGLVTVTDIKTPYIVAVTGEVQVLGLEKLPAILRDPTRHFSEIREIQVVVNLEPKMTSQVVSHAGFVEPVQKKLFAVGYGTRMAVSYPIDTWSILNFQSEQVQLVLKPSKNKQDKEIALMRTNPFVCIYPYTSFKPISEEGKPIRILDSERTFTMDILPNITNPYNPLVLEGSHELFWDGRATFFRYLKHRSWLGLMNFPWVTQRMRYRNFVLKWKKAEERPEYRLIVRRTYTPAESKTHYNVSEIFGSWGVLTGWGKHPLACSEGRSRSYKPSYSPKKWQSRESGGQYRNRFFDEDTDDNSWNVGKTPKRTGSRMQDSSEERYGRRYRRSVSDHRSGHSLIHQKKPFGKGVDEWEYAVQLHVRGGEKLCDANFLYRWDREELLKTWKLNIKSTGKTMPSICASSTVDYPKPPCYYERNLPDIPEEDKQIKATWKASWGYGSCDESKFIKIEAIAKKSEDQHKYDQMPTTSGIKPWFYEQCEKNEAKGNLYSYACEEKIDFESDLHYLKIDVTYDNIPDVIKNYTKKYEHAVMYALYPHMTMESVDVQNKEKHICMEMEYYYNVPTVVDIKVKKPTANIWFHKVDTGMLMPWLSPPNIRSTIGRRWIDYWTNGETIQECGYSQSYLNTFTNESYTIDSPSSNHYVLAKDCSSSGLWSVLVQHEGDDKKIVVRVLKHEIALDASSDSEDIIVNGEPVSLDDRMKVDLKDPVHKKIVCSVAKMGPVYHVILAHLGVRIKYDTHNVRVLASHLYSTNLCGLCGNMDSESSDFLGPQECEWAEVDDFITSWEVPSSGSAPKLHGARKCESDSGVSTYTRPPSYYSSSSSGNCEVKRNIVKKKEGQLCFSTEAKRQCAPGCSAVAYKREKVPFHCLSSSEPKAIELQRQIKTRVLHELASKKIDTEEEVPIPVNCN